MISYQRLPGRASQQSLNGISDWFGMPSFVKDYWQVVKQNIANIRATGPKISAYQQRIAIAQQTLLARGNTAGANALTDELLKIQDDLDKWWRVNGYLDSYLPTWAGLDDPATVPTVPGSAVSGLGFIPLVLSAVAIAALAYVVNTGMALVQDYMYKSQLTQAVIDQKMSSGQMKDILSVPREEGVLEKAIDTVGVTAALGIPTVLLVGGGIYLLLTTGVLNKLISSIFGGSASSTPASGA
jgi:hypothetical protein